MSIRNITNAMSMPEDLAKKLKPKGVTAILLILWDGYKDLLKDKTLTIDRSSKEDEITIEWYNKVFVRWYKKNRAMSLRRKNIRPEHQHPDETLAKSRGYNPTIDFCFRDWDSINSYFGAECKNLYENCPEYITRYVKTGIDNYTSGRYGSKCSENAIIGYVLSGDISNLVADIKSETGKEFPVQNLTREVKFKDPQFFSKHKRTLDNRDIILHHLFFDFT